MKEIKAILHAYDQYRQEDLKVALATVVRVEGSSYRRVGARMLVLENGIFVGGISGGCLEGDALKRARFAIADSKPSLVTYNTFDDDAHQIGVGLGCNGIIDVLFSPIDKSDADNPVEMLRKCISGDRKTHILLTVTALSGFSSALFPGLTLPFSDRESLDILEDPNIADAVFERTEHYRILGKSLPKTFVSGDRQIELFIEILSPEIHLVMMGGQYDVLPLCKLAGEVGYRTTVVTNPLKVAREVHRVAGAVIPPDDFDLLSVDLYTAVILMSHDLKTDKTNLVRALKTPAAYIGMLGPRVRAEKIFSELAGENITVDMDDPRLHAPVGLDIGAVSPEEISLSVLAEIRASFSGRNGAFLRLRATSIHERE